MAKESKSTINIHPNAILEAEYSDRPDSLFVRIIRISSDPENPDKLNLLLSPIPETYRPQSRIPLKAIICPTDDTAMEIPSEIEYFSTKSTLHLSVTNFTTNLRQDY